MSTELEGIQDPEEVINETEVETEETEVETEVEPKEEVEEYQPDFKFKYKDEEFQFDERLQGIVKDKETEQFVRDLVTAQKAIGEYKEVGGIREIQEKLGKYSEYEEGYKGYQALNEEINQLSGLLQMGNTAGVEAFRKHLGIDKDLLLNWAIEEAKAKQDPALAQQIEQQRQLHEQNFSLQYQNHQLHNKQETEIIQQRTAELDSLLGSDEISHKFDTLVGTPGSFKQEVIRYGAEVYNQSNGQTVLSVPEAVMAVRQKYQGLVAGQNSGTNTQATQPPPTKPDPQQTVVIRQEGKKTIPSLGGGQGSPAKQRITSLEQMRQAARAMD